MMLGSFFAVFAGVSFALLYVNLSRYVAARGAVQEAARKVARCISATDNPCVHVEAEQPPAIRDWYGYRTRNFVDLYGRSANYSITMPLDEYRLEIPQYEVLTQQHRIEYENYELPVTRFVGLLNSWAILKADVDVLYRSEGDGEIFRCRLPNHAEIPWGLDFSKPSTYLDDRWCAGVSAEDAAIDPRCRELADPTRAFHRYVDPNWASSCGVRLPGAPESIDEEPRNEQPWLLLGGDPICDTELPELPVLSEPLPHEPPWGPAQIGDSNKPFLMTVERQYLVVEVATCNAQQTLEDIRQRLQSKSRERAEQILEIEAIARFFPTTPAIAAPRFDRLDFNVDVNSPEGTLGLNSLFLLPDRASSPTLNLILPDPYDWTFFKWERLPDRNPQDSNAQRTFLHRRVCGWQKWESALAEGWTGLDRVREPAAPLVVAEVGESCPAVVQKRHFFTCTNKESRPAAGDLDNCGGWSTFLAGLQNTYDASLKKMSLLNSQNVAEATRLPLAEAFQGKVAARWSKAVANASWQRSWRPVDERGKLVPMEYQRDIAPLSLIRIEPQRQSDSYVGPSWDEWLESVEQKDSLARDRLGWRELVEMSLSKDAVVKRSVSPLVFEFLAPFADSEGLPLDIARISLGPLEVGDTQRYDFDLDCVPDTGCPRSSDSFEKTGLEERLRSDAAERFAEQRLLDNELKIEIDVQSESILKYLGRIPVTELAGLRSRIPACAAILTSCSSERINAEPEFLGRSRVMPAVCSSTELVDCFAVHTYAQAQPRPSLDIDIQRARNVGLTELRRIFPDAQLASECQGASCLEVEIDRGSKLVNVAVRYQLPISYPLDAILDQSSIAVDAQVSAQLELELISSVE